MLSSEVMLTWPSDHTHLPGGGFPKTWPAQPSPSRGPPGAQRFTPGPRSITYATCRNGARGWQAVKPILTGRIDDWRGEYAYTLGEQAFVYGFPYIYSAQLRHAWVTQRRNPSTVPYAPVNHFWHAERLLDATYRDGGCPNNDTLYSAAWVNLGDEPVILSHPDMGDRYFAFELVGITSDNFDYVGQRTTGSGAGSFALLGPGWKGKLPAGVRRVKEAPSPWVLVLGRTLVSGPDDVPRVRALQEQYRLVPLSLYGKPDAEVPESRDVLTPIPAAEDPLGPWKTLNAMLAENPPPSHHEVLLKQFAQIGVGPGLDVEAQPDAVRQSLVRAAAVGAPMLKQQTLSGDWAHLVNGWRYPPPQMGRFGDDFLKRAADQSLLASLPTTRPKRSTWSISRTPTATSWPQAAGTDCASRSTRCRRSTPCGR